MKNFHQVLESETLARMKEQFGSDFSNIGYNPEAPTKEETEEDTEDQEED